MSKLRCGKNWKPMELLGDERRQSSREKRRAAARPPTAVVVERAPKNVASGEAKAGRFQPSVLPLATRKSNSNRLHASRERARQQKRMEKIRKKVARRSG